jgi:hypothetical protein
MALRLALLLSLTVLGAVASAASADDALYAASALVTGTDMRQRPDGFGRALRQVLVNLSGEPRLGVDPRLDALAARAGDLVASYSYRDLLAGKQIHDEQGTNDRPYALTARFEPAQIDRVLADLGERPWLGQRPTVVPVLRIRSPGGLLFLLGAEEPDADLHIASFYEQAERYRLPAHIPSEAEFKAWGASPDGTPSPAIPAEAGWAVVAGSIEFTASLPGWTGSLTLGWQGSQHAWSTKTQSYDEAFRAVMQGVIRVASGHGGPE